MKNIICILDNDENYSKKFCNVATKLYNNELIFLCFNNTNSLIEYSKENNITSIVISYDFEEIIEEIKTKFNYVLTEINNNNYKEGRITYLYKYQKLQKILDVIKNDIKLLNEEQNRKNESCKLLTFYSPYSNKLNANFVKKIANTLSKKNKVLLLNLDEYDNYKSNIGFSNIIYLYKEGSLGIDGIRHEIVKEKELDVINSVSYPEDFAVINNIDLGNIINAIIKLNYEYVIVNADNSYIKNQYIMLDSDKIILYKFNDEDNKKIDILKQYLSSQCILDINKIIDYKVEITKKNMSVNFIKEYIYDTK